MVKDRPKSVLFYTIIVVFSTSATLFRRFQSGLLITNTTFTNDLLDAFFLQNFQLQIATDIYRHFSHAGACHVIQLINIQNSGRKINKKNIKQEAQGELFVPRLLEDGKLGLSYKITLHRTMS